MTAYTDYFSGALQNMAMFAHQFAYIEDLGLLIFARLMGFMMVAPVLGRKDIPFPIKMGFALMLTAVFIPVLPLDAAKNGGISSDNILWYVLQLLMNATVGLFIGMIAAWIMEAVNAAGSMMNNQIGLSSAMMFDPSSRQQVAILDKLFGFIGLTVFFQIGGLYWLISALHRSFEIFPVYSIRPDIIGNVSIDYLVTITGNSLVIGTILVAPVIVVTIAVDMILGIVNRTAQQIQVFQLSFGLKPSIGMAAFLLTMPIFLKLLEHYFNDYARIF